MAILNGFANTSKITTYDASGTIATGGTAQLVLAQAHTRTSLFFQNISDTAMYVEFGCARATATLSSGTVASCAITNAGFNFSIPPRVRFLGGGNTGNNQNNPTFISATLPDYASPANPAKGHCVMSGSAPNQTVASIVIDNPGSGYGSAPYVQLVNDINDPQGVAAPSTTSGIYLPAGGILTDKGLVCGTDAVSVYCASTGKAFTCKYTI